MMPSSDPLAGLNVSISQASTTPPTIVATVKNNNPHLVTIAAYQSPFDGLILELGNLFKDLDDWRPSYRALIERAGDLLVGRLEALPAPFCLLCAEKRVADCHRQVIADFLVATREWTVEHIE